MRLFPEVTDALRALARAGPTRRARTSRDRARKYGRALRASRAGCDLLAERASYASVLLPVPPRRRRGAHACEHEDRKPSDGMWRRAAADLGIDLSRSYSVGDGERDVVAGKRAGTIAVLLAAGRDKWPLPVGGPYDPDFTARDLREAAIWILDREGRPLPARPGAPLST